MALFTEDAKKERYYNELRPQLDQLRSKLVESHKGDLQNFKDQIKLLLEKEIVLHYYLEKGAVELEFKNDDEVKKAIEVLNNSSEYKKILNLH